MLDFLDEIESDLSVFHRVDDPMALDCSRYYRLTELLPHYDGALRHAIAAQLEQEQPGITARATTSTAPTRGGEEVREIDDPKELEAISNQAGMFGFEYVGG